MKIVEIDKRRGLFQGILKKMILVALLDEKRSMTISEISRALPLAQSQTSKIVKELMEEKYVEKEKKGFDERKNYVRLTSFGRKKALIIKVDFMIGLEEDEFSREIVSFLEKIFRKKEEVI